MTLPLRSKVAVWKLSKSFNVRPADDQVLVSGSYSSAASVSGIPPATSTLPFCNKVAEGEDRAFAIVPAGDQDSLDGSYSSASERDPELPCPPTTRTLPLGSKVAVCDARATASRPEGDHELLDGS